MTTRQCARLLGLAVALAATSLSCGPAEPYFRGDNLRKADLAGFWTLTPQSAPVLAKYVSGPLTNVSLYLGTNGQANATNFPVDIGPTNPVLTLMTARGEWELERNYSTFQVSVTVHNMGQVLDVMAYSKKLALRLYLGVPGHGESIVFNR